MEVVVPFAQSGQRGYDVVARRVSVVEWLVAEPVCQGVDAEGGLLDEEDSKDARVNESSQIVTPPKTGHQCRENQAHEQHHLEIVPVLPSHHEILIQVGDIRTTDPFRVLLHQHPPEVRVEEPFADGVWIFIGVGVPVLFACRSGNG